jgi:GT2 family glycosyltransferase
MRREVELNWILMPIRNGVRFTMRAMPTLLRQDVGKVRVMVLDNASDDGSLEWLKSCYPRVITFRKLKPMSVAQSWNKGLELLFDAAGVDKVLVVNNDVELREETYRLLDEHGGGFVTGVGDDNPKCVEGLLGSLETRPHPDFSCYLIRKWVWDKVGRFDEQFKGAYAEDGDYHLRMHQKGVEAVSLNVPFYHAACGTIKSAGEEEAEAIRKRADKNRKLFEEKWGCEMGSPEYYELFKAACPR